MSFLDTLRRAKAYLDEQGRVSFRALKLEFGLDDDELEALIEELVDIQQVAAREGKAVAWIGAAARAREAESPAAPPRSACYMLAARRVESTRSQKSTVSWRRSASGLAADASGDALLGAARCDEHRDARSLRPSCWSSGQ